MSKFSGVGFALLARSSELLVRGAMCAIPTAYFAEDDWAWLITIAVFMGLCDGWSRLWAACNSCSLVAAADGLEIHSWFQKTLVPWADVLAIRTWHHFNRIDYVAVQYRTAARIQVATSVECYGGESVASFLRASARYVNADSRRSSLAVAGLCEPGVALPLLRRFALDVSLASGVGCLIGAPGPGFCLGLLAASASAGVVASRHPVRTATYVLKDGLWCIAGAQGRPVRTIPRALRLWVRAIG